MKQATLFEIPKTERHPSTHSQIQAFKKLHGIWTYRSKGMSRDEKPWSALKRPDPDPEPEVDEWALIASWCDALECSGHLCYGEGEVSAIRELCNRLGIPCTI